MTDIRTQIQQAVAEGLADVLAEQIPEGATFEIVMGDDEEDETDG